MHYLPVVGARKREISPRFLSEDERVRVADLRRAGLGVRAIAGRLFRSPSTVTREAIHWQLFLEHLAWRDSTLTGKTNRTQPASGRGIAFPVPAGRRNWFEQQR